MLLAIGKSKLALKLNKPAYIRMGILELSKVLMYEFHYDCIKDKYINNLKLLFKDTDILMYEIKTADICEAFRSNKEMFDFSNDSTKSKYYDNSSKLVIGKMKNETAVIAIKEFVPMKTKMCSFLVEDNSEHEKAKDVNRNVIMNIKMYC